MRRCCAEKRKADTARRISMVLVFGPSGFKPPRACAIAGFEQFLFILDEMRFGCEIPAASGVAWLKLWVIVEHLAVTMMSPVVMSPSLIRSPCTAGSAAEETEQMQQLDMESDVGEVVNVVNVIPEDQEPTEEQPEDDFEKALGLDSEVKSVAASSNFGETMAVLALSPTEVHVLRQSFDFLLAAMGR
eukprot:s702_g14.t1